MLTMLNLNLIGLISIYFESYEGIISIRKLLDSHAELSFKCLLTESIAPGYDPEDQNKNREQFIELRKEFLNDVDGQNIIVASQMFPTFRGVVTTKEYTIEAGETGTEYKITVNEAGGSAG